MGRLGYAYRVRWDVYKKKMILQFSSYCRGKGCVRVWKPSPQNLMLKDRENLKQCTFSTKLPIVPIYMSSASISQTVVCRKIIWGSFLTADFDSIGLRVQNPPFLVNFYKMPMLLQTIYQVAGLYTPFFSKAKKQEIWMRYDELDRENPLQIFRGNWMAAELFVDEKA